MINEVISLIRTHYPLEDKHFKKVSSKTLKILLPKEFPLSRIEFMEKLKTFPFFVFDKNSKGLGSSIGRLKYKNIINIYIKFLHNQGNNSSGKQNERCLLNLINDKIKEFNKPITVIFKNTKKELIFKNITECKDSSFLGALSYYKSDICLMSDKKIISNISLKKENAIRWESSKKRFEKEFNNFIEKSKKGLIKNIRLIPIEGTSNKFKLFDSKNNTILSKIIIKNTPKYLEEEVVFGKDNPKTIVIKQDFEIYNKHTFNKGILILDCYQIYETLEDIYNTDDEPIFAFSHHIHKTNGIELRSFSKNFLYKKDQLIGNAIEIDFKDIC